MNSIFVVDEDNILMGAYVHGNAVANVFQKMAIFKWIKETIYLGRKTFLLLPESGKSSDVSCVVRELKKYLPITICRWEDIVGDGALQHNLVLCLDEGMKICVQFIFKELGIKSTNILLACNEFLEKVAAVHRRNSFVRSMEGCNLFTFKFDFKDREIANTSYIRKFKDLMVERKQLCISKKKLPGKEFVIPPELKEKFLDDLYSPDYWAEFKSRTYEQYKENGITWLRDVKSKYVNIVDGKRVNLFYHGGAPDLRVWMFGQCVFFGSRVEDKNTIGSVLQQECNQNGHEKCMVINQSDWSDETGRIWKMVNTEFTDKDVVIVHQIGDLLGAYKINPVKIAYENNMPYDWFTDAMPHANHHALNIWAKAIYKSIESCLDKDKEPSGKTFVPRKAYIQHYYLDTYFSGCDFSKMSRIGSIVMNCNPFTKGHRYLIEQARKQVDALIIFVVEEDKSYFDFTDRFAMVCEGVKDMEGVIVVPSGDFILSASTFPEYFIKIEDKDILKNVEYDVSLFGECIAQPLGINYRFVGEELSDPVTEKYNRAMERILPNYGVEVVEIPRITCGQGVISASLVRKHIEAGEFSQLKDLLPETTLQYLENMRKPQLEIEESYNKITFPLD